MTAAMRPGPRTRFAPAPTGRLHLGHLANALYVWGMARARGASVVLRIEDHDRQRCRPEYEAALLADLERLGFLPDEPAIDSLRASPSPYRQSDCGDAYREALERLDDAGLVYACECSRSAFDAWAAAAGERWRRPGCPSGCRSRGLPRGPGAGLRVALGDGDEGWVDAILGERSGPVAASGDLLVRDRLGNWTYALCVVVDDDRHAIDLVIRGEDLLDATPAQIRLARLLGRDAPPTFAHHPLVRRPDGTKLSKADGATSIADLLDRGATRDELIGEVARRVGLAAGRGPSTFEAVVALLR